jgi:hypothetical protein
MLSTQRLTELFFYFGWKSNRWTEPYSHRKPKDENDMKNLLAEALFRFQNSPPNYTMQKEDFPSYQNTSTYMEY